MTDYDQMMEEKQPLQPNEIIQIFLDPKRDCSEIPMINDCIFLRDQYNAELNAKGGGCTPCKKRSLIHKYSQAIRDRL